MNDLTGQQFGNLTVLPVKFQRRKDRIYWTCQCACGRVRVMRTDHLRSRKGETCNCLEINEAAKALAEKIKAANCDDPPERDSKLDRFITQDDLDWMAKYRNKKRDAVCSVGNL